MISRTALEAFLKDMGMPFRTDGTHFVHSAPGKNAPTIRTLLTLEADGSGATLVSTLPQAVATSKRPTVMELLNLVHGQSLGNIRFFLDEDGHLIGTTKLSLWGRPFNPLQLEDLLFTVLASTDRLFPCIEAIVEKNETASNAFKSFFSESV